MCAGCQRPPPAAGGGGRCGPICQPKSPALRLPLQGKVRLDAYLASKLPQASRARLQASIKEGLVSVNGRAQVRARTMGLAWGRLLRPRLCDVSEGMP